MSEIMNNSLNPALATATTTETAGATASMSATPLAAVAHTAAASGTSAGSTTASASTRAGFAAVEDKQTEVKRAFESGKKVTARTIMIVVAIIVGILLVLFVVSRAALYESIFVMLGDMGSALAEVVRRIFTF